MSTPTISPLDTRPCPIPADPPHGELSVITTEIFSNENTAWRALSAQQRWHEPFFQPEWFAAFSKTFADQQPLHLLTARAGRALTAVAPLMRTNSFFGHLPARSYRSLSGIHSCRYDLVQASSDTPAISHALWSALCTDPWWEVIEVLDVPHDGAFGEVLERAREDGFPIAMWPTRQMPRLSLSPKDSDPLANCPRSFQGLRSTLSRKLRKLSQEGSISFSTSCAPDPELQEFLKLEASGWKGINGSAITSQAVTRSFYERIADAFSRVGALRLHALRIAGKPIAMQFALIMNGVHFVPKSAYDEHYSRFSPGQLLVRHLLQELPKQGVRTYDFLGPQAPWKSVWTLQTRQHANLYIFRPTIKGRLLHFGVTQAATRLRAARYRLWGDPQAVQIPIKS